MKQRALVAVVAATVTIATAYATVYLPPLRPLGPWLMALGVTVMMIALMVLGAVRRGAGLGALRWPLAFTFVVVAGGFAAALLLPPDEAAGAPIVLGFPLRAAIVLYGVGLLPLIVLPWAYARTFDSMTLSSDDMARIRALAQEARRDGDDAPGPSPDGAGS